MNKERKSTTVVVRLEPSLARALDAVSKGNETKSKIVRDALIGYFNARTRAAATGTAAA